MWSEKFGADWVTLSVESLLTYKIYFCGVNIGRRIGCDVNVDALLEEICWLYLIPVGISYSSNQHGVYWLNKTLGFALASQLNFSSSFVDLLPYSTMVNTQEFAAFFCTYSIWILTSSSRCCRVSARFTLERRPGFAGLGGKTVGIAAGALSLSGLIPSIEVPSITIHRSRNARNVVNEREDLWIKRFILRHPPTRDKVLAF